MKYKINKNVLIEEGIGQFISNNWGKGLVAASGLVMANAGVFGDTAKKAVEAGGAKMNNFIKDAGDWSKEAVDKMEKKYGDDSQTTTPDQQHSTNSDSNTNTDTNNFQDIASKLDTDNII